MVSAQRGGGLVLGGIVTNTTRNMPPEVHMRSLDRLIAQTTGIPREKPMMEGVLAATVPAHMRSTPELMPAHEQDATASKMAAGVPYDGMKSGYGMAEKSKKKSRK